MSQNIPQLACPSCGGNNFVPSEWEKGKFGDYTYSCSCVQCNTGILTGEGKIDSYYIGHKRNGKTYFACFYLATLGRSSERFVLEYSNKPGTGWQKLVTLSFFPNINYRNFAAKLRTILTFH